MSEYIIPCRFLTLVCHLCVAATLLWENDLSTRHCLPARFRETHHEAFRRQLVGGYSTSIALICFEFLTFLTGYTMFSKTSALISTGCHGCGSILLTYFILDTIHCEWFWFIFAFCSVLPFIVDKNVEIEESDRSRSSWTFILILAAISTTFGSSLPVGYNIGVINTPAEVIRQFCNESFVSRYDVTLTKKSMDVLWSFIVSIFIIGGVTGSCIGAFVADKIGRKGAVFLSNFVSVVGALSFVLSLPCNSVEMLILGRLLVGLSGGLTTSVVPMYLMELSPLSIRGSMGAMCPLGVTVGVLLGQIIGLDFLLGTAESWHYLLGFFGLLVIAFTPILIPVPESPKYLLVIQSKYDEAIKALCRVRGKPMSLLSQDIAELRNEGNKEDTSDMYSWTLAKVIRSPDLRRALLLVCCLQAGQQTSGINAVFYYSTIIFKQANMSDWNAQLATLGAGLINCGMAILAIPLLARCGRRMLALVSIVSATVCLIMLCISITLIDSYSWMPRFCIAAVLLYVLFYGIGLGPIPYFIGSELFEVGPRPAAMALGSLCNWGGNFLVGMTFLTLRTYIGACSFLVFALSTGALGLFVYFYLPESKGKSPAQITALCQEDVNICGRRV